MDKETTDLKYDATYCNFFILIIAKIKTKCLPYFFTIIYGPCGVIVSHPVTHIRLAKLLSALIELQFEEY